MSRPSTSGPGVWQRSWRQGTAEQLLAPWPAADRRRQRQVAISEVAGAVTLVLGSTQWPRVRHLASSERTGTVSDGSGLSVVQRIGGGDCHLSVVKRASGGGAVLVGPGDQAWVDVWVPRGDPLWDDDVVTSSGWLGEAWCQALETLGIERGRLHVHRGSLVGSAWSSAVCFAGVGPGEVLVDGMKLVGLAQRRNREGAWFQMSAHRRWDPDVVLDALVSIGSAAASSTGTAEELRAAAIGLDQVASEDLDPVVVAEAVVAAITSAT